MSLSRYLVSLVSICLPSTRFFRFKRAMLRAASVYSNQNTRFNSRMSILGDGEIRIGEATWVGYDVLISVPGPARLDIGANCDIAPRVQFICGSHASGNATRRAGPGSAESIIIGAGTWIGCGAIVLGGAEVGSGCMIAAGAVVRKGKYPQNSLIAGNPAKVMKTYPDDE